MYKLFTGFVEALLGQLAEILAHLANALTSISTLIHLSQLSHQMSIERHL